MAYSSRFAARTAEIVAAYLVHNKLDRADLPALIATVHAAVSDLGRKKPAEPEASPKLTAAQIRKSIGSEHLVSFEDGRSYRTLTRHLKGLNLTPEAYREKWGLGHDYPMVSPAYSQRRSELAKSLGLGRPRKGSSADQSPAQAPAQKAASAPRKRKAAAAAA